MSPHLPRWLTVLAVLTLGLGCAVLPAAVSAQNVAQQGTGYYYVVTTNESWAAVSARTGVSIARLMAANPRAIHPNNWLWTGDRLWIPGAAEPDPQTPTPIPTEASDAPSGPVATESALPAGTGDGYWYDVKSDDTWLTVSRDTGIAVLDLWHANPDLVRRDRLAVAWRSGLDPAGARRLARAHTHAARDPTLRPGDHPDIVPDAGACAARDAHPPAPTATAIPTAVPPTEAPPTEEPSTATPEPTPEGVGLSSTPSASGVLAGRPCPANFAGYPDAIAAALKEPGASVADLTAWLTGCGALKDKQGSVTQAAIHAADASDLVVVLVDPASDQLLSKGMLLVYFGGADGYVLAGEADGAGQIALVRVADLNQDGKPDLAYTDTSCGAHTCFSTLFVDSWDGSSFRDWIDGQPTMASATYSFAPAGAAAHGLAIQAHGGVIGSVGAGPQRAWTETYTSSQGEAYKLAGRVFDPSPCLYFAIVDANQKFDAWAKDGFGPAVDAYQAAIDNTSLTACGGIPDELATLRDYARFRLMISDVGNGKPVAAGKVQPSITTPAIAGAAKAFMDSFNSSHKRDPGLPRYDGLCDGQSGCLELSGRLGLLESDLCGQRSLSPGELGKRNGSCRSARPVAWPLSLSPHLAGSSGAGFGEGGEAGAAGAGCCFNNS